MAKLCNVCEDMKSTDEFYINSSKSSGYNSECKTCSKEHRKVYYLNNKKALDARAQQWRLDNPEKHKNNEMKRKYGITVEDYNNILDQQKYSCAICEKTPEENGQDLAVDHCHYTKKVRGLLCKPCNRGLGMFQDRIDLIQNTLGYLSANKQEEK